MANPQADLGALTVRRDPAVLRPPRRWVSRVVIPGALLAGFAALAGWAAWDRIRPPLEVRVVPVQLRTGTVADAGGELFKANGWIEPRPLPTDVPVQTTGSYRVREVRVNPGDRVRAGQVLVLLDDEPARLDLEAAKTVVAKREAAVESALADAARAGVTATNAEAAVGLARREGEAEVAAQEAEVKKAESALAAAALTVQVEEELRRSGAVASDVRERQARQQRDAAGADVTSARARLAKARTAADVRVRTAEAARAAAAADLRSLQAKVVEARQDALVAAVEVKRAELELARTRITAPVDGAVMQLNARVGSVLGGRSTGPEPRDVVVTLYDPKMLQVRVEVPLAKFPLVRNGHPALVEVEDVLPGQTIPGTVLYDTRLANIARNSVPVKVALPDDPPESLRPEMIASVRFQSPARKHSAAETVQRMVVPRRLLIEENGRFRAWVVDPVTSRAELKSVDVAPGSNGEQVEVAGGLQPTDRLIATGRESLSPGTRVRVTGEDR